MQCAANIGIVIKLSVLNGRTHACSRCQVNDHVEFSVSNYRLDCFVIAKIDVMNRNVFCYGLDVLLLDVRIVKIVEIVED